MAEKKAKLQPLGRRVLVIPEEAEEKTSGGLYIPPTANEDKRPSSGKVVVLGKTVKAHSFKVKEGDRVYFKKYAPEEIEVDGEKFYILDEKDILAIVA